MNTKKLTTAAKQLAELETEYGSTYERSLPFDTLSTLALDDASSYNLGQVYSQMGTLGRVKMARQEVARERERLMAFMMSAIQQDKRLQAANKALDQEDELREKARSQLYDQLNSNAREEEALATRLQSRTALQPTQISGVHGRSVRMPPSSAAASPSLVLTTLTTFGLPSLIADMTRRSDPQTASIAAHSGEFSPCLPPVCRMAPRATRVDH